MSGVTLAGPADYAASGPADTTPGGGGGWYFLKFTNGAVGLQRILPGQASPANATMAQFIAPHNASLLAVSSTPNYLGSLQQALKSMATPKQQAALIAQLDAGAGKSSATNWLYVGPTGSVSTNTSKALTGDATPINQIPSPIPPSVGNSHLSIPSVNVSSLAIRVLEAVGGVLLLVLGLRALLGGDSPTVTLARAAATVAR